MKNNALNETVYSIYQSEHNKKLIHFELCGITYPDKNYEITRSNSPTMCIEYITKGEGVINADKMSYRVCEGDCYFLQIGQSHYYYADKDDPFEKYWINVSGPLAKKLTDAFGLCGINYFKNLDIKENICNIIDIAKSNRGDATSEILCEITKIFTLMHQSLSSFGADDDVASAMRDFIDMNVSKKLTIKDVSDRVSKSESQAIRIFSKKYGVTPYSYFTAKKTELAKSLLESTNMTVKQIAYYLGFSDEYYFSNTFKKHYGKSPSKFRKEK